MSLLKMPQCAIGVVKCFKAYSDTQPEKPCPKVVFGEHRAACEISTTASLPDFEDELGYESEGDSISSVPLGTHCQSIEQLIEAEIQDACASRQWRTDLFEFVKPLQEAPRNQGRVDLFRNLERGGSFVAVKRMPKKWMTAGPREFALAYPTSTERPWYDIGVVNYLHSKGYQYVCEPIGVFSDARHSFVVNSYANKGELFAWLEEGPAPGPEREDMIRPVMKQLFTAIKHLHDLGIAHRDISLENVLLNEENGELNVRLVDFGMATTARSSYDCCGKRSYIPPETTSNEAADPFLGDAFQLGVTLFSVCCREYPWASTMPGGCKMYEYVSKHGLLRFLQRRKVWKSKDGQRLIEAISEPLARLLVGLLQIQPQQRFHLGEKTWEDGDESRPSVWDVEWL